MCSFGLVVVYCRWIFLSGKMNGAAPKAASAHSWKPRQNELLLARVDVDVAHRENAGHAGGELLGVHLELLALDVQAPCGDRAQLGRQAEEHQQHVQRHHARHAVGARDLGARELAVFFLVAGDLADDELHLVGVAQLMHLRDRWRARP